MTGNVFRVWDASKQENVEFTRNTRYNPSLTVMVSENGAHWSMAKGEHLREVEAQVFSPTSSRQ